MTWADQMTVVALLIVGAVAAGCAFGWWVGRP